MTRPVLLHVVLPDLFCFTIQCLTTVGPVVEGKGAAEALPGESQTVVEVSGDETYSIEQTVQMGVAIDASGAQIEVERQTIENKNIAPGVQS
jgi:hypothetical protein